MLHWLYAEQPRCHGAVRTVTNRLPAFPISMCAIAMSLARVYDAVAAPRNCHLFGCLILLLLIGATA